MAAELGAGGTEAPAGDPGTAGQRVPDDPGEDGEQHRAEHTAGHSGGRHDQQHRGRRPGARDPGGRRGAAAAASATATVAAAALTSVRGTSFRAWIVSPNSSSALRDRSLENAEA